MNKTSGIGVIYYNFSFNDFPDFFNWCREHQVNFVEIQANSLYQTGQPEEMAEKVAVLLDEYHLCVSQLSAGNDFIQQTPEDLEKQINRMHQVFKLAHLLGTNLIRVDGGWPKEGVEESKFAKLILYGLEKTVEMAEKEDIYLALDNHGSVTNNYQFQLELLTQISSKRLGANLDTMNYRWYGYSVEELPSIYEKIAPYVRHTHLKDGVGARSEYQGKVLGQGEIPLSTAFSILKKHGYTGVWCVEYEGADKEKGYAESVAWLRKQLAELI
ncbi:MAG: sugar phosphate isomerase/epimerase [Candidatus Omnitrophica bacterium]|nr:sugar phosphate isomerase/epimerase [Candidatus Omnitrophota bacterium]MCM8769875.1 sugar phosphate isomerase/epimerase [Candidatus Omnitrophota bacterium]